MTNGWAAGNPEKQGKTSFLFGASLGRSSRVLITFRRLTSQTRVGIRGIYTVVVELPKVPRQQDLDTIVQSRAPMLSIRTYIHIRASESEVSEVGRWSFGWPPSPSPPNRPGWSASSGGRRGEGARHRYLPTTAASSLSLSQVVE